MGKIATAHQADAGEQFKKMMSDNRVMLTKLAQDGRTAAEAQAAVQAAVEDDDDQAVVDAHKNETVTAHAAPILMGMSDESKTQAIAVLQAFIAILQS